MYLSHPVRRLREDPIEGEEIALVVRGEDETNLDSLASAIEVAGGTIDEQLAFGSLQVTIPQERVEDLCQLDGIESIETDNTVGIGGSPSEDV